jgi:hypothetical protein
LAGFLIAWTDKQINRKIDKPFLGKTTTWTELTPGLVSDILIV